MPDPTLTRHPILRTDVWHPRIEDYAALNGALINLAFNATVIRKGSGPAGLSRVRREDLA